MSGPALALATRLFPDGPTASDLVAVPVDATPDGPIAGPGGAQVEQRYGVVLAEHLARVKATGEIGDIHEVPVTAEPTVLLVGRGDGSVVALRRAAAALARRARGRQHLVTTLAAGAGPAGMRAAAEGLVLGSYAFTLRRTPKGPAAVERVELVVDEADRGPGQGALDRATAVTQAVWLARDLANTPANLKDPAWLADRARELAEQAGLGVRIWDEVELAAAGFGGVIGVGMGSARPPRLIELSYAPDGAAPGAPHVVLVGKGITFDSGGLSLKPREAMVPMKTDMAAGGAVIATMAALAALGVRARVTALVPAAENLPSGTAQRPGDVITQYGGTTVEVLNTDAEGRLVLADALAYAVAHLAPDALVDLATLTGAASLGLGRRHAALYTEDDELAGALIAAGEAGGERLWRMPLVEDYRPALDSAVADISHISRDRTISGGSITAGLFLREFAGGGSWAHLDIAGPARADGDEHEISKGGTGFGVRTLLRWLEDRYADPPAPQAGSSR